MFAAQQINVFPTDFDTPFLILIYAALILGGAGSIGGAILGGLLLSVMLDGFLRSPTEAGYLFYGVILLTLIVKMRPWRKLAAVLAATVGVRASSSTRSSRRSASPAVAGGPSHPAGSTMPSTTGSSCLRTRRPPATSASWSCCACASRSCRSRVATRTLLLVPTLYLAACVWEGVLVAQPSITRQLLIGAILIVMMNARPAGPARLAPRRGRLDGRPAEPVLELDKLSLAFGGLKALTRARPAASTQREVVSVIGPNGAGQDLGVQRDHGRVRADRRRGAASLGESIGGKAPHQITRPGIARTFQSLRLFLNMSVNENVMAATYGNTKAMPWESILRLPRARREEREVRQTAEEVLSFFGQRLAGYRWEQPAYSLSYANRRRLEIARALATRPKLLLLDEPAAGMNPNETHEVAELIGRLRNELGLAILVIEHDMHVVEGISDRVVALDHGVKITEGTFEQVATHPAVVEAYLGRDPEALAEA